MLPLRFPWLWWTLGWALVAGVCFGSLVPGPYVPRVPVDDKFLHAGAYCLLMIWFCGLYRRERYISIAVLLLLLGLVLDGLQGTLATRSFDFLDVAANGGGILIGWILSRTLLEAWCQRIEHLFTA